MTPLEAMKQALEALEESYPRDQMSGDAWVDRKKAITALSQAIEQMEKAEGDRK